MIADDLEPAFRQTLFTGGYNLLLGAGVSLDSRNGRGELLRGSEELRRDLCKLTGAREGTSLTRAYALLSSAQRQAELVDRFSNCTPGPSVSQLSRFLWRRLFTFNIDDVVENHYVSTTSRKQDLSPLNFDASFEPTPERHELLAIHLHGWSRQPEDGFVFSASEYTRVMHNLNPWMHLLAEILATEPFIIAGTSLNEIDLEYYLSHRSPATPRRGRGPSLLVEPSPDVATRSDCERYGLILVPASFREFMDWVRSTYPTPPSVTDLVVPDTSALFPGLPSRQLLRFFSDFELVAAADHPQSKVPGPFLYGREPTWDDLHQHVDIERQDSGRLAALATSVGAPADHPRLAVVLDDAGTGKTTVIRRVAHSLATLGKPVLSVRTLSRIDTDVAIACLSRAQADLVLIADGVADHVDQILELLDDRDASSRLFVLAAERTYRREYLDVVLGDTPKVIMSLAPLRLEECEQLIERYRQYGLVADQRAVREPREFAKRILQDPVAIAVCRILNDFRPLDAIVESLWRAADPDNRLAFVCVSLAQHCYWAGLRYSILQTVLGQAAPIGRLLDENVPLRLAPNALQDDFLVAGNAVIGERVLHGPARTAPALLLDAFKRLAGAIAPYVNRKAIMRRSPEARLAGRLFDGDKVVRPLLGDAAEDFYVSVQKEWEWNSRYWEQRALLAAGVDLDTALQYARHAVAIESHPFPLTTLSKLLLMKMESSPETRDSAFSEALDRLSAAIDMEATRSRITIHPYSTLISGAARYLELGGVLSFQERGRIADFAAEARHLFAGDALMESALDRLNSAMG